MKHSALLQFQNVSLIAKRFNILGTPSRIIRIFLSAILQAHYLWRLDEAQTDISPLRINRHFSRIVFCGRTMLFLSVHGSNGAYNNSGLVRCLELPGFWIDFVSVSAWVHNPFSYMRPYSYCRTTGWDSRPTMRERMTFNHCFARAQPFSKWNFINKTAE